MGRVVPLIVAIITSSAACGCGGLGVYRSLGHLPGIAPTDYAFYNFCGTYSQLYPASPPQVESSMMEALGDLGFQVIEPPDHQRDGGSCIRARTPDGRPSRITITPQNNLTNVRVKIGPDSLGDYELSRDLLRRVALNFGTVMRAFTPIDTTLPQRNNSSTGIPPRVERTRPITLDGEGLRPAPVREQGNRDQGEAEETGEEAEGTPASPIPGCIPTRAFPNPPYMPYAPFPYVPYNVNPNP